MQDKSSQRFNESLAAFFVFPLRSEEIPLRHVPHAREKRGADSSLGHVDIFPYLARVLDAVASGVKTSREFADLHNISIYRASEYFSELAALGWIKRVARHGRSFDYALTDRALARASNRKEVPLKK